MNTIERRRSCTTSAWNLPTAATSICRSSLRSYDDSDDSQASIVDTLSIVKELFEEATFTYGRNQEARAIRTSDVGD
jgi:hypothetical protein